MRDTVEKRLLREEEGFSLSEVLVTMLLMIVVLFALYSLFDMSLRIYSVGNDKTEALENARLGLEKMEREIRGAYPYDLTSNPQKNYLFFSTVSPSTGGVIPSSSQITFGNDLNGNWKLGCPAIPTASDPREYITYKLVGSTLRRVDTCSSTDAGQPVVEFVREVDTLDGGSNTDGDTTPLTFKYFTSNGVEINPSSPGSYTEADIAIVRIKLEVAVDRGIQEQHLTQTLTTDVALRNRGQ